MLDCWAEPADPFVDWFHPVEAISDVKSGRKILIFCHNVRRCSQAMSSYVTSWDQVNHQEYASPNLKIGHGTITFIGSKRWAFVVGIRYDVLYFWRFPNAVERDAVFATKSDKLDTAIRWYPAFDEKTWYSLRLGLSRSPSEKHARG